MHAVVVCVFVLTVVSWFLLVVELQPSLKGYRRATQAARASHVAMLEQEAAIADYLATGDEGGLRLYVAGRQTVRANEAAFAIAEDDGELAVLLRHMRQARDTWVGDWAAPTLVSFAQGGGDAEALLAAGRPLFEQYRQAATELIAALAGKLDAAIAAHARVVTTAGMGQFGLFVVLLAVARRRRRFLVNAVAEPVGALLDTMEAVCQGDLDARAVPAGPTELRRLAQGFAAVTSTLAERHAELAAREGELATQAAGLRTVLDVARRIAGADDVDTVVDAVGRAAAAIGAAERVVVWSVERELLVPRFDSASSGPSSELAPCGLDDGPVAGATRRMVVLPAAWDRLAPLEGRVLLPMTAAGRAVGVLDIHCAPGSPIPRATLGSLEMLAGHAAAAMQAARLYRKSIELSRTDPVTSLPNRRRLDADLGAACDRAGRYGRPLAFVMIDIDRFKEFNDSAGHGRGDDVLRCVGRVLASELRRGDTAYRYGGDEFAVLLPESGVEAALELTQRLRRALAGHCLGDPESVAMALTASFGVAALAPGDGARQLLDAADRALYEAKRTGRDRAVVAAGGQRVAAV